jgi:acylglycerol lipase
MTDACARVPQAVLRIDLAMLWYYGTEDRLVSAPAIQAMFERLPDAAARDQTIKRYAGYFHELHNEPAKERQVVIDDVLAWMSARLTQPSFSRPSAPYSSTERGVEGTGPAG